MENDEALITAALEGSARAWDRLVRRYENRIYNYGLRITGNPSDALDLMQEVFLGVYRNLHRFRGDASFRSWLFRIAHNKAIDMNRRRALLQGRTSSLDEQQDDEIQIPDHSPASEPDRQLSNYETNRQVQVLLAGIPLEQRLVVELKIYQSLTFEEIAAMQEISENTAKTRFYTALKKLKTVMEERHVLS